ncbi:hypothetical protein A3D80_03990 [Candidatus Roizmanbacteria bacterium RIFCSPHIGHO2_02_FULL_40_13b]|uniref:HTH arsR-type domain-containing protein n=1 Tax=Candidatus Roizmanbacteria bacterium RIFCSPHIGHO2_01_FULL_39_24 TaxID=1802032 RepID=A0A1F7GK69_9BACT|nr:MAG: hypothetical protein A2799_03600 [Candidatus Roizmanbacteria bacterium RIFCSPHIGHO2_01_FULL_39_24]OGK27953.1 MAG: hypothetical protein A3D80_03990 [Candidatus Roizmanbacteria bacterium RIFCSPHIGHO2_02_FULL_40_13b]OGK49427.1 MAG: hypothetical protein A3A56_03195 [Candidatus Roizmanbacteria bacterium RIFCSPLOWO2_01_FULL_40_32]OGK56364.1 MAG: hypothetical protein A3H83_02545 [Candidatus Roizmanbacteria bacterium RIFCSPLOWO2_02_FULL_39_8]
MLRYIIPSQTRRKILALFFQKPQETYHLRRVGREVGEEVNAVKRELDILEKAGVLEREKRVNKVMYTLNPKYLFYDEFLRIFAKEGSLAKEIVKNVSKLGRVKFCVLSAKFAHRISPKEGEIYLLLVGIVVVAELNAIISFQEKELGFEINYSTMTEEEFKFRKKNNDPFIWQFLKEPKIMLIGNESDLVV